MELGNHVRYVLTWRKSQVPYQGGTPNWDPRLSSKSLLYNQWEKHWSMVPTYTKIMLGTPQYQAMKDHEGMTNTLG